MFYQEIQNQFNEVIKYSQGIENPKTDELFAKWAHNKAEIILAFGNKLIYEVGKVSFTLDESARESKISQFLTYLDNLHDYSLFRFFSANREGFLQNQVIEDYNLGEGKIIAAGSKLIKAFKHFIKDPKLLEEVQNKASEIIQENKIEGTLCFSVHPLDFLSISETTFKWRSCHALDGEYRAGNLSYMTDSSTIICYLKSDEEKKLPNFPETILWNDKKWRCLLFLSDNWDCMFAGRQYPFFSGSSLEIIRSWLMSRFLKQNEEGWTRWYNRLITDNGLDNDDEHWDHYEYEQEESFVLLGYQCYKMGDLISEPDSALHYNDLLYSGCYIPYYMFKKQYMGRNYKISFHIGNDIKCLGCGESFISRGEGTMYCNDCHRNNDDNYCICSNCGNRYDPEESWWIDETEEYVCNECFYEKCFKCEECGDTYWKESHKTNSKGQWICLNCHLEHLNQQQEEE